MKISKFSFFPVFVVGLAVGAGSSLAFLKVPSGWFFQSPDNLSTLLGYALVAGGTLFGYHQWAGEQRWKRREVLMNTITAFDATPGSRNAMMIISCPDRDIPLLDAESPKDRYTRVTWYEVAQALIPDDMLPHSYNNKRSAIRDSFEDFLGRLSYIEHYVASNLLDENDVKPLVIIWGKKIEYLSDNREMDLRLGRNLKIYIEWRGLTNVQDLFERFESDIRVNLKGDREIDRNELAAEIAKGDWDRAII